MATTGVVNGSDLLVYIDGNAIGYSTSCSISFTQDNPVVTSKDDDKWAKRLQGNRDVSISTDGYIALDADYNLEYLYELMEAQTGVTVRYSTNTSGDGYFQVAAVISSLNADAPDNEGATFSVEFESNGAPELIQLT